MRLYYTNDSGNSWKVRNLLSLLRVSCELVEIDWNTRAHKQPPFLDINPRGQVPAMEIEGRFLWDSTAHLVYIARRFGGEQWMPVADPLQMAEVSQWLAIAQNEVHYGLQWARGVVKGTKVGNLQEYQGYGRKGLEVLSVRLAQAPWLACDRPTLAEIACYPYVASASEAGINLRAYPYVVDWLARCEALPGWLPRYG